MPNYRLVDQTGKSYEIPPGRDGLIIGRHRSCGLVVNDPTVSRRHARLFVAKDRCWIRDENSKSGTIVNQHRITAQQELQTDSVVQIGPAIFGLRSTLPAKSNKSHHLQDVRRRTAITLIGAAGASIIVLVLALSGRESSVSSIIDTSRPTSKSISTATAPATKVVSIITSSTSTKQPNTGPTTKPPHTPTATQTSTPEPTVTLAIRPVGRDKHRSDLIVLCHALQYQARLESEYYSATSDWKPNFNDNDFGPELVDLDIFTKTLSALVDATFELPKTKITDTITYKNKMRLFYYKQQNAWRLLAEHYETGSQTKYDLYEDNIENSIKLWEEYTEQWESIASDYQFDDWTCARTDGTPSLVSAIDDLNHASLVDQMATIANQVNSLRELTSTNNASSKLMSRDEFRVYNEEEWFKDYDEEANNDSLTTLVLLGLVESDFDLRQMYLDSYGSNVLGFYDDEENTMVTVSDTENLTDSGKSTYAHEYTHALQFNNHNLEEIGLSEEGWEQDSERAAAIQAVIEGEATLVGTLWREVVFANKNYENVIGPEEADSSRPEMPTWYLLDIYFPYANGYNFVANVYSNGGWDAVNTLYETPPVSTEMIMHPQKYWDHDIPIAVDAINIQDTLGVDWQEVESGVMGEYWTYLILRESIAEHQARLAAAGWGGDSYTVARNAVNNQALLAINWVFDSSEDAKEFHKAISMYSKSRFGNTDLRYTFPNQTCTTGVQISCILQDADISAQWIVSPSIELVDKISYQMLGHTLHKRPHQ